MHDLGGTTQDLHDLGIDHPAEKHLPDHDREHRIQSRGTHCRRWGAGLLAATTIGALACAYRAGDSFWDDHSARTLTGIAFILGGLTGAALLTVGLLEEMMRPMRTISRAAMARANANAELGGGNRDAVQLNNRLIAELLVTVAAVEKRLAALETAIEAVPDYGKGVIDGATMRANALGGEQG